MAGWLTTARETLTGAGGASAPQTFTLPCRCGYEIAGTRGERERTETCPDCGTDWFVLPRDVYPRPARARKRKAPRPQPRGPVEPRVPLGRRVRGGAAAARTAAAGRLSRGTAAAGGWVRRQARPLRLVVAGLVLTVLLTGGWLVQRERLAAARRTYAESRDAADAALTEREYAVAADRYAEAAAAADRLGLADPPAAAVRGRARELAAARDLAVEPPFRIAEQAAAAGPTAARRAAWRDRFDAVYAGRWVVLDAPRRPP